MAARRAIPWASVIGAMAVGATITAVAAWRLNVQAIDGQIKEKQSALKRLALSGRIPPNEDVMQYLTDRQAALERRDRTWVAMVASPPPPAAALADPQLYFQEQFHEVQRTLERLAAARTLPVPESLGFPKELPPKDTVPRLLVQLSLLQDTATLIFDQEVAALQSLKIEDPETVPDPERKGTALMRLPVRVRCSASLPQLMKMLAALQRTTPLIDVRAMTMASGSRPETLDVEIVVARYLIIDAPEREAAPDQKPSAARQGRAR